MKVAILTALRPYRPVAALACLALLASCAQLPPSSDSCDFGDLAIRTDFSTARASGCRRAGAD